MLICSLQPVWIYDTIICIGNQARELICLLLKQIIRTGKSRPWTLWSHLLCWFRQLINSLISVMAKWYKRLLHFIFLFGTPGISVTSEWKYTSLAKCLTKPMIYRYVSVLFALCAYNKQSRRRRIKDVRSKRLTSELCFKRILTHSSFYSIALQISTLRSLPVCTCKGFITVNCCLVQWLRILQPQPCETWVYPWLEN